MSRVSIGLASAFGVETIVSVSKLMASTQPLGIREYDLDARAKAVLADMADSVEPIRGPLHIFRDSTGNELMADGWLRLRGAFERNQKSIVVVYHQGNEADATAFFYRTNSDKRALPISREERNRAMHILYDAGWSDRRIAGETGLSHVWVGKLRHRSGNSYQLREGIDGRVRRVLPRPVIAVSDDPAVPSFVDAPAKDAPLIRREWCMCSKQTFTIKPIRELLEKYVQPGMVVVDPCCGDSDLGTYRNDLNPSAGGAQTHLEAREFLKQLVARGIRADVSLLDPPYSPTQAVKSYGSFGADGKTMTLYRQLKDGLNTLLRPGGIAITVSWNSAGFGLKRGYELVELLIVCHGGAHHDTIVTVERKQ